MSQRQRKVSTAKELRVFLVHLLCILTLVQGPPLEAAEQKVRERTLWVGEAESAEAGESLPDKAAAIWDEVKEELAEDAEVLKAPGFNTDVQKNSQAVAPRSVMAGPEGATVAVVPAFNRVRALLQRLAYPGV